MKVRELPPVFSRREMSARGMEACDFVFISGDAYVDHPSFAAAIICRVLIHAGYTVGVIAQPDWHSADAFRALGRPRLGFLVCSGNIDSMVNHYTAAKKPRTDDAYTPGGVAGKRPDRAAIVYGNRCREAYAGVPVILGGIEASLRRFAHYDYWDDRVRHSILYDAAADLLIYGMGERTVCLIAARLRDGVPVSEITDIPGTCWRASCIDDAPDAVVLPSFAEVRGDKRVYAEAFRIETEEQDAVRGRRLVQPHEKGCLVCNPPAMPLDRKELDAVYALPFTRETLPKGQPHVPAVDEVLFSITSNRGCFGGCSFCALTFHQGRVVQSRSHESILAEARELTNRPDFKGYIHDIGGPTANFRNPACEKQLKTGACKNRSCIGYTPCRNLSVTHEDYTELIKKLRSLPRVKKVFVRSGVRYDYVMLDRSDAFLDELVAHHISGQLKVAPEHVSDRVLRLMNKPPHEVYTAFVRRYEQANRRAGTKQFLVPYLISSHPGSTLDDAIALAQYLKRINHRPEQVQDFYPTPGTVSTTMYYTGLDPRTMESVYVPKSFEEKQMQRALMQYFLPRNHAIVRRALRKAGREDLIGTGKGCLVPEERGQGASNRRNVAEIPMKRPVKAKNPVDKRHR